MELHIYFYFSTRWGIGVEEHLADSFVYSRKKNAVHVRSCSSHSKMSWRKHLYVQGVTVHYSPWHHPFQKLVLTICFLVLLYIWWTTKLLHCYCIILITLLVNVKEQWSLVSYHCNLFQCLIWHLTLNLVKFVDLELKSLKHSGTFNATSENWAIDSSRYRLGEQ